MFNDPQAEKILYASDLLANILHSSFNFFQLSFYIISRSSQPKTKVENFEHKIIHLI